MLAVPRSGSSYRHLWAVAAPRCAARPTRRLDTRQSPMTRLCTSWRACLGGGLRDCSSSTASSPSHSFPPPPQQLAAQHKTTKTERIRADLRRNKLPNSAPHSTPASAFLGRPYTPPQHLKLRRALPHPTRLYPHRARHDLSRLHQRNRSPRCSHFAHSTPAHFRLSSNTNKSHRLQTRHHVQ